MNDMSPGSQKTVSKRVWWVLGVVMVLAAACILVMYYGSAPWKPFASTLFLTAGGCYAVYWFLEECVPILQFRLLPYAAATFLIIVLFFVYGSGLWQATALITYFVIVGLALLYSLIHYAIRTFPFRSHA